MYLYVCVRTHRLRGALRRMHVPSPEEYDEEEYTEACGAMKDALRALAFANTPTPGRGGRPTTPPTQQGGGVQGGGGGVGGGIGSPYKGAVLPGVSSVGPVPVSAGNPFGPGPGNTQGEARVHTHTHT